MFSSCLYIQTRRRGLSFHTKAASSPRLRSIDKINLALLFFLSQRINWRQIHCASPRTFYVVHPKRRSMDDGSRAQKLIDFLCFRIE